MRSDHVDTILEQWRQERPDIDIAGMAIIGRISRLERLIRPKLNEVFADHDLEAWEFDLLATLRRSGEPYQLTAGHLLASMMITSGAVTNRIDRLEQRGLIRREKDPSDGRVVLATLTPAGLEKIDAAVVDHASNEIRLISGLASSDRDTLEELLRALHECLIDPAG